MLQYLFLSIYFLIPPVLAVLVILGAFFLIRKADFGIACVLIGALLQSFFASRGGIHLGINIFISDLLPLTMFGVGLLRLAFVRRDEPLATGWWLALLWVCLLFVSVARGLLSFGAAAGNDFRLFFYFIAVAIYLLSFPRAELSYSTLERYWIRGSVVMMLIAMFRWVEVASGVSIGPEWSGSVAGSKLRVLPSGDALFIATGMLLLIARSLRDGAGTWQRLVLALMAGTVLLLQHRSVWVATLAGFLVIFTHIRGHDGKRFRIGLGWVPVVIIVAGVVFSVGKIDSVSVSADLAHSIEEVGEERSTIAGRIDGWRVLIGEWRASGPVGQSIGQPMGTGYERYLEVLGRSVNQTPHNYYVQTLVRSGFLGLFSFMLALFVIVRGLRAPAADPELQYQRRKLLALLVMNMVYITVYQVQMEQALVFGFAMLLAARIKPARRAGALGTGTRIMAR